jgi:hypothetical protein
MVVGHMWTMQHGMDGPISYFQMKVGHHMHPNYLLITLIPKVIS